MNLEVVTTDRFKLEFYISAIKVKTHLKSSFAKSINLNFNLVLEVNEFEFKT